MANDLPDLQPYDVTPVNNIQEEYHESSLAGGYDDYDEGGSKMPFLIGAGILGLVGVIALLFLLFGNQGNNSTTPQNPNIGIDPNESVTLFWWGVFLDPEVIQPLIDDYKSVRPNVTIQYSNIMDRVAPNQDFKSAESLYMEELNRTLGNGNPTDNPDIFMVKNTWAGDYEIYSQPSTTYTFDDITNLFYPTVREDFANSGVIYGVPVWMDTLAVVYNNDLLNAEGIEAPAEDWFLFREQAEKLTKKSGNQITQAGFAAGNYENVAFNFELANLLWVQNGVEILNENNEAVFGNNLDTVDATNFLTSFSQGTNNTWNQNFPNESTAFLEGRVAMIIVPSWRLREILRVNENLELGLDIRTSRVPQISGQSRDIINWSNYWGNMVAQGRPSSRQSWEFLQWITEPAQQRKLHDNIKDISGYFGHLYPRADMLSDLVDDTYLRVYNESLPFSESWYMIKGKEVEDLFKENLSENANQGTLQNLANRIFELQALKGFFN